MSDTVTPELEAVASAIYDDMNKSFGKGSYLAGSFSKEPYAIQDAYLSLARAALTAIREPTEGMIKASASSDAAFDGREFSAMGRADRERYCSRCKLSHTAVIDYITGGER